MVFLTLAWVGIFGYGRIVYDMAFSDICLPIAICRATVAGFSPVELMCPGSLPISNVIYISVNSLWLKFNINVKSILISKFNDKNNDLPTNNNITLTGAAGNNNF